MSSYDDYLKKYNLNTSSKKLNTPDIVTNRAQKLVAPEPINMPARDNSLARNAYETLLNATNVSTYGDMIKNDIPLGPQIPEKAQKPIIEQSFTGDVLDANYIKNQPKYSGNTLLDNTIVPVMYGIGKGAGGGAVTKVLNGYNQEELDRREALAMQKMGKQNEGLVKAGTTASSVATPIVLTSMGVPAPAAYGMTSALNKAGETDDLLDIGVGGVKGIVWGTATGKLAGINNAALSKIPITNTNIVANATKNFVSPLAAATTSNYGLGKAEDLYNTARGREVTNPTTLANSVANAVPYALIQGTTGTIGDIRTSKAQMQADIRNATEDIENLRRQANTSDTQYSSEKLKQTLARKQQAKIDKEIEALTKNKYLTGRKDLLEAVEQLKQGNAPQVEIPKAQLALPAQAGQTIQNNVQNVSKNQEIVPKNDNGSQNNAKNLPKIENEQYVETNIGNVPIAEYRDIAAQQAGFDSYADMYKQGYRLGNGYDIQEQKVENTENPLYNDGRGDLNGERTNNTGNKSVDASRENKLAQLVKTERERAEELTKTIKTKSLSSKSTTVSSYEKNHNNIIDLIDGEQASYTDSKGNMHLNEQQVKDYGEEQIIKHETPENLLTNHIDEVIDDFSPLIDEIFSNEKGLMEMFKIYSKGLTSKQAQALILNPIKLAKETFCDFNASTAGHETAKELQKVIIDNYGEDLYNKVIAAIKNKDDQIYGTKNSEKGSFSMQKNLEKRLNGDRLLDAQDLIKDITDAGGQVDDNGYVTVYHRTTPENAKAIQTTGKMSAKEDGLFFSSNANGTNNKGYGSAVVELKIPAEDLVLDDIFDDEVSLKLPIKNKNTVTDVSNYLVSKNITKQPLHSDNQNIFTATSNAIQDNTNKAIEEGARALAKPNENLSTYKKQMFQNNANAINDLISQKNTTLKEFDNKIAQKKQELAGKKDQTTKIAQTLRSQITNLEKRRNDAEAKFINKIDRLENHNANINKLKNQVSEDKLPTRAEVKENIISEKGLEDLNLDDAKDINKFIMNNTIPARVNEKVFNPDTATKINDRFFKPIKANEANRTRFLNREREEIKSWGIEPKSKESAAVQMYGEGEYVNPSTGESSPYTLTDLKREFPNDWEKIKTASEKARAKYDNYIDTINKELNKMGYDSIPKLKNYFRHFEQTKDLIEMFGIPGKANKLPTDLNGLTADLKPGKNFFSNALKRTGNKTDYDAITGIDGYLEGASKLMYHTEDIQNLRTLEEYIRNKFGSKADLEGLSKQEFNKRVDQIQGGHLSEYASWLTEYTNNLAGKKSMMDRGTENAFGRRVYGTLNALKKQVGSNLTGLNINSALSNFISAGQGLSSTSKVATLQGLVDTLKSIAKQDDFIDKSDFLTTRFGSDKLSKTLWEKASNAGQIFMSGTDYFTANLITRSKYHEYLNKGYPEQEAIEKAGEYADRLMAGRGLGDMPNFFNSKTLGILTQFQLENVNQFDSMFHDNFTKDRAAEQTKYEAKTWNEKIKSKIARENPKFYNGFMSTFVLAQLFAAGWMFNKIVNKLGGTGGAFDPIGTVEDFVKDYQKDGLKEATSKLAKNVLDDIPYANLLTGGGRIPMKDSLPNLYDILTGESTVTKEGTKLLNILPPTGGGQLRKTIQGAKTLINNGEYGKRDGNEYAKWLLDLENKSVPEKIKTSAQALLFGKYGPEEAKKYIENNYKGLTVTETKAYKEAKDTGMSAKDFSIWVDALKNINPKKTDKNGKQTVNTDAKKAQLKQKLNNSDLTDEQKKILYGIFYSVK